MPYAIVLYFDQPTENQVRGIWEGLAEAGISREILNSGIHPHITLAIYDDLQCQPCEKALNKFATRTGRLKIQVSHLGFFSRPEFVLFLAPTVTAQLLEFHAKVHKSLAQEAGKSWEIYQPGNWVPHCTLVMNLDAPKLNQAISHCKKISLPLQLHATRIGAVEFVPVADLFQYDLKSGY